VVLTERSFRTTAGVLSQLWRYAALLLGPSVQGFAAAALATDSRSFPYTPRQYPKTTDQAEHAATHSASVVVAKQEPKRAQQSSSVRWSDRVIIWWDSGWRWQCGGWGGCRGLASRKVIVQEIEPTIVIHAAQFVSAITCSTGAPFQLQNRTKEGTLPKDGLGMGREGRFGTRPMPSDILQPLAGGLSSPRYHCIAIPVRVIRVAIRRDMSQLSVNCPAVKCCTDHDILICSWLPASPCSSDWF
jgi:hypothetical protein